MAVATLSAPSFKVLLCCLCLGWGLVYCRVFLTSAPFSALSLPLLFAKERGSLHILALLPAVVAVTGYFMLVWLVEWGGECCLLFSIDLNLSPELCDSVQP